MAERIPGLIIRIVNDTGIIAPPLYERYPTIVGTGDPYCSIQNYKMTKGAGTTDTIPTVTTVNEIVSIGDLPGVAKYVDGVDYQLATGDVSWLPAGSAPTNGNNYYITYTETRAASAYEPILYFDENLIYSDHGNKLRTNGAVNDVSVSGSLVLNAGGRGVIICQLDPSTWVDPDVPTNSELETAYIAAREKLNKITGYKLFLIPMDVGTLNTTTAADILFNHAVIVSQPERAQERTVIAPLADGTTYQQFAAYAQGYANERMVVPATPGGECTVAGVSGTFNTKFHCAALAGKLCSVGIGNTISNEVIPNVYMTDTFTPDELDYLVKRGVSPANISGTSTRNILAITTDTTSALTEDLGVQDVKDYVKKYWRDGLYPVFQNKKITTKLIRSIVFSSENILEYLISQEIIEDFKAVSAAQDPVEPRKVNISGKVKPAFCLQWIDVVFTFVLNF
jgi:hypothetical protein